MTLSDTAIRTAKPRDKSYKLYDTDGLFLVVATSGSKLWRMKYHFNHQEKVLSFGPYPMMSLREARERRDAAKKLLYDKIDPAAEKKRREVAAAIAAGNTFGKVAREFLEKLELEGIANATKVRNDRCLKQLDKELGSRPMGEVEPVEVLAILKKFERRGVYETVKRLRAFIARVYRYAIVTGRARYNPAADLADGLVKVKKKHLAAIIDPAVLGDLLRSIETFNKYMVTTLALRLTPHLFVRPGELRHMEWTEIDWQAKVWRIPEEKMKMRREHVVPLSHQALAILEEAKAIASHSRYVFPSIRTGLRPISENTINVALRRLPGFHR